MTRLRFTLLAAFAALAVVGLSEKGELFGRSWGPKGKVYTAKPTLSWEVWSTRSSEIVGARATLNGQALNARYDASQKKVLAPMSSPLEPGSYSAKLEAVLDDGQTISKAWKFEVTEEAIAAIPSANASQHRTIEIVNRFRASLGLPAFKMDDRLNAASLLHSKYHAINNTTGHYETPGKPGFIGEEPGERHEAMGWVGSSWENVEYGSTDEADGIRSLIDAPYHRIPFLQPGDIKFGSGYTTRRLTTAFSMSSDRATVLYPFDKQQDVPTNWNMNEKPNPLRIHPGARRPVGYPIMLVYFDREQMKMDVRTAKLIDDQGAAVPCYLNTPENDSELTNAVILIPKTALRTSTTYMVRVEAAIQGGPEISKTWTFRTVRRADMRTSIGQPKAAAAQKSGN